MASTSVFTTSWMEILDERRGVVRVNDFQARREERFQLGQVRFHRVGGVQRVGAGGQLDTDTGRRLAVVPGDDARSSRRPGQSSATSRRRTWEPS